MAADSLTARIEAACERYGDQPCVLCEHERLSHRDVFSLSGKVASALSRRGVAKGDRVGLYLQNGAEFVILYLAIIRLGAVVVPINLLINTPEIRHILDDAEVSCVLVAAAFRDRLEEAVKGLEKTRPWVFVLESEPLAKDALGDLAAGTTHFEVPRIDPSEDLVAILYTSGTTGFPKGAMLTHANLVANTQSVHEALCFRSGQDRVLVVLPMFHAFAATVGVLTPLINGSAIIPLERFEPDLVCDAILRHSATIFLGVPSMFKLLLKRSPEKPDPFSAVRFAISGGAAMPVPVLEAFEARFHVPIHEGDGPTECSPVTCVNPISGMRKPGTVGLPVPGVEMRILDERGRVCPLGEIGEIAVRGQNVMKGYWGRPDETAEVLRDGWLLTGDLGSEDEDGYFSIVDRKKDLILVNGMNVYPRMVEEVVQSCPGVLEVAVVGELDDRHGEVPVAYVVLLPGSSLTVGRLREHARTRLGRHQIPKRMVILDCLPRNAGGKILKRELRKAGEVERGVLLAVSPE